MNSLSVSFPLSFLFHRDIGSRFRLRGLTGKSTSMRLVRCLAVIWAEHSCEGTRDRALVAVAGYDGGG